VKRVHHDGPVIVGAGLAGLSAALAAAPRRALLLSPAPLGEACSSAWAQGGIAAAVGAGDSPALHARDTVAAGGGLVDLVAASELAAAGLAVVERLAALGARFDRDAGGAFRRAWRRRTAGAGWCAWAATGRDGRCSPP
jgi:L-aspartate oxidase